MKLKANGTKRGRLNARGYEQVEGTHYIGDSIAAPVTTPTTVRTMLTLLAMNPMWISRLIDVEGAFLQGKFVDGEKLYVSVPDGFEDKYEPDVVLEMNVPIYGTKQAAACFYKMLVEKVKDRNYQRSKAEPCLYFIWNEGRLSLVVSWVDDLMAMGHPDDVKQIEIDMMDAFQCKSEGELKEYVGSKIDIKRLDSGLATVKFTNPVLVQKLSDEYNIPPGRPSKTPAIAGQVLVRGDGSGMIDHVRQKRFRSGTATCMYIMQWSRPDIYNTTRGLARQMSAARMAADKALDHLMRHVVATPNRGLVLAPDTIWDGSMDFEFTIHGRSDSDYAANTDDRRSVSGGRVFLNEAPVCFRSLTQKTVTLSVTEAESAAGVMVAQDMLHIMRLLASLGLKVKLPMLLEMDNKGAVDLANNWSVGGRTRHVDVRNYFLRELKDQGILVIRHVSGEENDADIFTKNVTAAIHEKHIPLYVGVDEYMG